MRWFHASAMYRRPAAESSARPCGRGSYSSAFQLNLSTICGLHQSTFRLDVSTFCWM